MSWKFLGGCKPKSAQERFEIYTTPVTETGCLLWMGPSTEKGYGRFKVNGVHVFAHRYAWTVHNGRIPHGMLVCHKCDTPSCVNHKHLFLGTYRDNSDDKVDKSRQSRGEHHSKAFQRAKGDRNGSSKLKICQIVAIRNDQRTQRQISAEYGISQMAVWQIKNRKTWRHV